MRLLLLLLGLVIVGLPLARAGDEPIQPEDEDEPQPIWFYVDDAGLVTFVDSLDLIPGPYRGRAQATNLVTTPDQPPPREVATRPRGRTGEAPARETKPRATPEPQAPSRSERLAQLRGERDEIVDELGALAEGWGEQPDLDADALERRSVRLEERLRTVDQEISELEKTLRR
jgi:hypothetical protein